MRDYGLLRTWLARAAVLVLAAVALAGVSASSALAADPPDTCPGGKPAVPAGAKTEWSEPQCVSPGEQNGEVPRVAMADNGSAIAVWRFNDDRGAGNGTERVEFSTRVRGQNFTAPDPPDPADPACPNPSACYTGKLAAFNQALDATFVSSADHDVGTHIRLATNQRGDAIVVWEEDRTFGAGGGSHYTAIMSAYKPHDGGFEAPQVVIDDTSGHRSYLEPEVGIDGQGQATVIYHQRSAAFNDAGNTRHVDYVARTRPSGGTWGDEQAIAPAPAGNDATPIYGTQDHGSLAVAENGDRFAAFTQQLSGSTVSDDDKRQGVITAVRRAGDSDWNSDLPQDNGNVADRETTATWTSVSRTDESVAFGWAEGSDLYVGINGFGERINGSLSGPANREGGALAVEPDRDALALWSDGHSLRARAAFNANFADPPGPDSDPIPGNGDGDRTRPALAPYGDSSKLAAFQRTVSDDEGVLAALRKSGSATKFDDPVRLSVADGKLEDDDLVGNDPFSAKTVTGPQVAANASGEGVAAWSGNDGTGNLVVNLSILTPRGNPAIPPPPPPPPRPKPAVSSPIQLARPLARDEATVLVANVPDGVQELRWSFGTKDEPDIVGKVEGGHLQNSVRLRLPNTAFRAKLHTTGSDGTHDYSRSFSTLGNSSSSESKQVRAGLKDSNTPPVFAVGTKSTLIGGASDSHRSNRAGGGCSPTTIWSGEQKMSGCFEPIEKLADIPNPEKGAVHELGNQLNLDESKKALMDKATQLTDGYVSDGKALLNDKFPVTPTQASSIVSIPQAKSLISAKADLPVGGGSYDPKNGFNLKLDPKKVDIPLGKMPKPPNLPKLGGLEIVGDWDVDLDKKEAKIKASVVLPKEITKAGLRLENEVRLTATPDKVIVDGARVGPADVDLGGLKVNKFKLEYTREGDQWDGQGKACVISGACIDMSPPNGHVTVKGGKLAFAGASVIFPPPGIPLFAGVDLKRIGFGIGTDPTRMIGSAGISALQLVNVDGRLVFAFPSTSTPFILRHDEVGDDFPASLYNTPITRTTIGMSGHVGLQIPETDDSIEFGHAYVLYEYPGYVALGGGFDLDLIAIVQLHGGVSAEVDVPRALFNIHGDIQGCLLESDDLCGGAVANVSHGPNKQGGAGACISVGPLSVGGGVQWRRLSSPFIWPLDGCKWSRFKLDVRPSSAGTAGTSAVSYPLDVKPGAPNPVLKLTGRGGAPLVRVRGPGGQLLNGSATKTLSTSPGAKIRILRFKGNKQAGPFTVVGLENAQPGHYTVEPLPGSAAITGASQAAEPPDAKISGRVTGKGRKRTLRYDVRAREGQKVDFYEVERGGAAQKIGTTSRGGRGKIRFKSFPGFGRRKVIAQFQLQGIPAERRTVATFKPQSPNLARPKRVRVKRKGSRLRVSWRKVKGATKYEVGIKLSSRRMKFTRTKRSRVTLKRVPRYLSGRAYVRALDGLVRQSAVARSKRFKGHGHRPSPFRKLYNCKIGKRGILCAPAAQTCGGLRPTLTVSSVQSRRRRLKVGTRGNDVIVGTSGNDRIDGLGGNDVICSGGGNDKVRGGSGRDRITGGAGNDKIDGGASRDILKGSSGNDRITGGGGDDIISGGPGRDLMRGGPGRDLFYARDRKRDRIDCGPGRDRTVRDKGDGHGRCERPRRK